MSSTDEILGNMVQARLMHLGIETPMVPSDTPKEKQHAAIEGHVEAIMRVLGLNMEDDSLQDTPKRVAKMYLNEIFTGLDYKNFPKCTVVKNKMAYNHMLVEEKIAVKSFCEHHQLPIVGYATVAYIPGENVIGLSKLNRIVDFFSRRPQVQERLTAQIYEALRVVLGTDDVAVVIKADHLCVKHRGIGDQNSETTTSKIGGQFMKDPAVRAEFFAIAQGK